jgi:TIGR03009 family protein
LKSESMIWWRLPDSGSFPRVVGGITEVPRDRKKRGQYGSGQEHGGQLPMLRQTTIMAARLLAVWALCPALCHGQAPDEDSAPVANPAQAQVPGAATRVERQSGAPRQAGAASGAADAANAKKMDWLLELWEEKSAQLKTLDVKIFRVDKNPAWEQVDYYEGRALFKSPNLAFIDFNKIRQDDKQKPVRDPRDNTKWVSTPFERIVCTGQEVWQYKSDTQQIFIFPLGKNEQKKAIEEGPLPFLFNMHAEDARKRYQMSLISEDAKTYGVSIKPKLPEDQESFSLAFVNLDRRYLLPVRIVMNSPDGKSQKDFRLGSMYPNKAVNDKNFEGKPLGSPWKLVRNPAGDNPSRAAGKLVRDGQRPPAAARPRADAIER